MMARPSCQLWQPREVPKDWRKVHVTPTFKEYDYRLIDLDDGAERTLGSFADGTKLGGVAGMLKGCAAIQHFGRLGKRAFEPSDVPQGEERCQAPVVPWSYPVAAQEAVGRPLRRFPLYARKHFCFLGGSWGLSPWRSSKSEWCGAWQPFDLEIPHAVIANLSSLRYAGAASW